MNEPFYSVPYDKEFDVFNMRCSMLSACYEVDHQNDINRKPMNENSNITVDLGSSIHEEDQILMTGARQVIDIETPLKIMHESEEYTLSGHRDYYKFDFNGKYIEDLKSTKYGSFFYFIKGDMSRDYVIQISSYSYLHYIDTGAYIGHGVITRIDKEETRNRVSRGFVLWSSETMRDFILNHPFINFKLGNINLKDLRIACIKQMVPNQWKCDYCQYSEDCKVLKALKKIKEKK